MLPTLTGISVTGCVLPAGMVGLFTLFRTQQRSKLPLPLSWLSATTNDPREIPLTSLAILLPSKRFSQQLPLVSVTALLRIVMLVMFALLIWRTQLLMLTATASVAAVVMTLSLNAS